MRKSSFLPQGISLLLILLCVSGYGTRANSGGLPQQVVRAHTVFIVNETGFNELNYTLFLELSKWGRFDIAESREKADLILRLDTGSRVRTVPEGQLPSAQDISASAEAAVPSGYTRVALLDPKTQQVLWSGLHKTEGGKVKSGHLLDELREAFRDYERGKR